MSNVIKHIAIKVDDLEVGHEFLRAGLSASVN